MKKNLYNPQIAVLLSKPLHFPACISLCSPQFVLHSPKVVDLRLNAGYAHMQYYRYGILSSSRHSSPSNAAYYALRQS